MAAYTVMSNNLSDNKRIAKNTIYLYIRLIFSLCINLYISRAILSVLGVKDYGIYDLVGGFVGLLGIFTNTFASAAQRFITFDLGKGDLVKLNKTFCTFVNIMILLGLFVFIVGELLGSYFFEEYLSIPIDRIDVAYIVFHCSLLSFIINLVMVPYTSEVIAHECMDFFAIVSISDSLLKLTIVILLGYFAYDKLCLYGILLTAVSVMVFIAYWSFCRKKFKESNYTFIIETKILKEIASYSFWVTIGAGSSILKDQGVNVLINRFCGVLMNAARGISMQVFAAVTRFSSSLGSAIIPQITKSYSSGDVQRSIHLTFLLAKAQGILLLFFSLPILLETDYILSLWLNKVPDYAIQFTKASIILCIARTFNASLDPLVLATGRVKWVQLFGGGLLLMNLPMSYILLKSGGNPVDTMIIASILEMLVMTMVAFILNSYVKFPAFAFIFKGIFVIILCGIVSYVVTFLLQSQMQVGIVRLVTVSITSVTTTIVSSYFIVLTKVERIFIRAQLSSKLQRFKNNKYGIK